MRAVVDTNLLVSAMIAEGAPSRLLDAARAGVIELCTSEVLLAELLDVLRRPHLSGRMQRAGVDAASLVVAPQSVPQMVASDPDDDHVLVAAVCGGADFIASGDRRDLLPMGSYRGIPILTAQEALQRIGL